MGYLLIDVGNTSTTLALGTARRVTGIRRTASISMSFEQTWRAAQELAQARSITRAIVSSVVPRDTEAWQRQLAVEHIETLTLHHRTPLPVGIDYPRPGTIGADRLANATAALIRHGAPVIVADFGTALTFDIVDHSANYIGGVIAPGLAMMTDYLADRTALLPRLGLKGNCPAVGRSTAGAMRIGARIGYRGIVREVTHYLMERNGLETATLCATGGLASWALSGLDMPFSCDPDLTLFGLAQVGYFNEERKDQWQ